MSEEINKKIILKLNDTYDKSDLESLKRQVAKEEQESCPSNISLLQTYHKLVDNETIEESKHIEKLLRTSPVRSLSGIVNVSVLTKPYECPGQCIYCPQSENAPQSYVDKEPAVMRAQLNDYDPAGQVRTRLEGLEKEGHPTDKIELRIIGATWSYYPDDYQKKFIKRCFDACNGEESQSLKKAQKKNEEADRRIIGLSTETRPDYINKKEIKQLRNLGVTRVELGVQTLSDKILKKVKRGHKVKDTIEATKLLKDAGFKVSYQMMPDLPGTDLQKDKEVFKELFSNSNFKPDLLKIYPTVVLEGTPLYDWYKEGKYTPYTKEELIRLIKDIKKEVPP
ncbi:MAG: tRNA uridine(34) 5-carboxymethylaminomethyl modification radical SAM/GNAT enzyme Elp3, partial [Candidatus Paceibacterota bacterium]